eukprot:TRINITY_DN1015_c0_g1_i1.p1 TRINITY_DN1015_c0_g1~~TRINITY_DN1015_c0_g1_i1.p1  ORF type:complete len:276 (+),score=99.44 TRINITY_DN1015_c0_g1_i1:106-933(+)
MFCYFTLAFLATLTVYLGSKLNKKSKSEIISTEEASIFPVFASIALVSLFILLRYLPKELIKYCLKIYIAFVGTNCIVQLFETLFHRKESPSLFLKIIYWILAAIISITYCYTENWIANNVLAICFCLVALSSVSISSFKTASLLLIGLFFYDIFWVFGTSVMVTVAKQIDAPIKIMAPKVDDWSQFAMLGLGDIVFPGLFVSLMQKFDRKNSSLYFHTCLAAYVIGLGTTMFIMLFFNSPQPALLYLVPSCFFSVIILAYFRNELKQLINFELK